ncbi:MAG: hypothetical protein IJU54_02195 [Alphaproteobacteria bacterium]|mgnify:CR=1 FL=1|nr:hypothetical protein [Alphaproteobacteria bacterium]
MTKIMLLCETNTDYYYFDKTITRNYESFNNLLRNINNILHFSVLKTITSNNQFNNFKEYIKIT